MILQELHRYYERLLEDPSCDVPPEHWSTEKAAWEIVLAEDGRIVRIAALTTGEGKTLRRFLALRVPEHGTRSGTGIQPFFLCDNAAYMLGLDPRRGAEKRAGAKELHDAVLASCDDPGAQAIRAFFARDDQLDGLDGECRTELDAGGFIVFRLSGDSVRLHEREAIKEAWTVYCSVPADDAVVGQCAVTGEHGPMARLFPQVTGVPGAQSAGASLVSFNLKSFESYGKEQAYNASLSEKVAFNAGSALKYLYSDLKHRVRFGQTTVVFWTDRPAPAEEEMMLFMLGEEPDYRAEDEKDLERIRQVLEHMKRGMPLEGYDPETRFYILGIAPNAARLAVRFFETNTFGALARHYGEYLRDIEMIGAAPRSLRTLLRQTAPQGEADAVPSTLINNSLHAMLNGTRFPRALPQLLLMRMRADHGDHNAWDMGQRAALMKACYNRDLHLARENAGAGKSNERSFNVALDRENTNPGYVLGRLFAVMERAQEAAVGETNTTIRGRYIGAASSTPIRVFQPLFLNFEHHLDKLKRDQRGLYAFLQHEFNETAKLLEPKGDETIPTTLSVGDQVNFFVGFHQEQQYLWQPRKEREEAAAHEGVSDNVSVDNDGE